MTTIIRNLTIAFGVGFLASLATAGQDAKLVSPQDSAARVHEVPKDGLKIDGKLTKDDPPLVNAPLAELKGAPHQVFQIKLQKGQDYVIELASKDFDAFLILADAADKRLAYDDDGGGGLDSRLQFSAQIDGTYRLLAASLDKQPGKFQLKIRAGKVAAEQQLAATADQLNTQAVQLFQTGRPAEAVAKFRQSLKINQELYPASRFPEGHSVVATSLNNLGMALQAMGQAERAVPFFNQALAMVRTLYPESRFPLGHVRIAQGLHNLGFALRDSGHAAKALPYQEQCLAMNRQLYPESRYPDGHPDLVHSVNTLGVVLHSLGQDEKALPYFEQGLAMCRKLFPESQYPDGHALLAICLNNAGGLLLHMGQTEKSLRYFEQGRLILEKLHPHGHPQVATSINNLGHVLRTLGQREKALSCFLDSLAMRERLYPASKYADGHPELATSLNNLGSLQHEMGELDKTLAYYRQSLRMLRKLYPEATHPVGHTLLVQNLNNVGMALEEMGKAEEAASLYRESVEMARKLFAPLKLPEGHAELARSLNNLSLALQAMGQSKNALTYCQESLQMQQRLLRRELLSAPEAAAFDKIAAEPLYADALLTVTRSLEFPAERCYDLIWPSRWLVTRLLRQRQVSMQAAGPVVAAKLEELRANRRRTERLLQDSRVDAAYRDARLAKLADERDTLERELLAAGPHLKRWQEVDALGPAQLARMLPQGAAFLDLIRYVHSDFENGKERRTPKYVAFVIIRPPAAGDPGSPKSITRLELGEAKVIDAALSQWRIAIEKRVDHPSAIELRDLIWSKIAPHVPADAKTLYVAADGDLSRLPWAALPIGKDRVLLEEYAVAQVPGGTFLLDHLKSPRKFAGPESLLVVGGVEYGNGNWPTLPGTLAELNAVAALTKGDREIASGKEATPSKLSTALSKVRFAHLATHGEFKAEELTAERKRGAAALSSRQMGDETRRVAAKNPLGYVGLVLAGGEIMSGLSIVDLDLHDTKLVTLSACETGLGEYTAGEGVQGLQRAFHIAGCPNVVASLWKVNDAATAALMAKFYHEMWVNKKPPIEALREAQLTIYRHPELIPDLAGERGPVRLRDAVAAKASVEASARRVTADTKLWAAFVLSGLGK